MSCCCQVCCLLCAGAELALKPTLNAKLVPAHARLMDTSSSNNADTGVPSVADASGAAAGGGASSSVG